MAPPESSSSFPDRAVYGLRLTGVDGGGLLAAADGEPWPRIRVEHRIAARESVAHGFGGRRACFELDDGRLLLERAAQTITTVTERPLSTDQLVHPWLAQAGAMWARWLDRDAFHGGAFVAAGGAWAVLGESGSGKSTLLARLATAGAGVLADDLLVLDAGAVLAGPRCVDVHPCAAAALGLHELPSARRGTRRRLRLGAVPDRARLAGIVHLAWGAGVEVRSVPLAERIERLRAHNSFPTLPAQKTTLLELTALPTLELRRPHELARLADAADALLHAGSRAW